MKLMQHTTQTQTPKPRRFSRGLAVFFRLLFTACLIGTVVFIFSNSAEVGDLSDIRSGESLEVVNEQLDRFGLGFQLGSDTIRKLAHMAEYMMLGFWLLICLRVYTRRLLSFIAWPLFLGLLVAVADETLQLYVPGRSGLLTDIWIDFAGIFLGLVVALFLILLAKQFWNEVALKKE